MQFTSDNAQNEEAVVIEVVEEPSRGFIEPKSNAPEWKGFWISKEKVGSRKQAKCKTCNAILSDRLEVIVRHKMQECRNFPDHLKVVSRKRELFADEPKDLESKQVSIRDFVLTDTKQKKAAELLVTGLICKSVPIRIVTDPHLQDLFKLLGVKKLCDRDYLTSSVIPQVNL